MAVVQNPLFSLDAHGSVLKTLTYRRSLRGHVCRKYAVPTTSPTAAQSSHRSIFSLLAAAWSAASASQKSTWSDLASAANIPPYAFFTQFNWARIRRSAVPILEYSKSVLPLYDSLILHSPLNEGEGTDIHNDLSSNVATLEFLTPATAWGTNPGYLTFDGADGLIHATTLPPLVPSQPWTFSTRLFFSFVALQSYLFTVYDSGTSDRVLVFSILSTGELDAFWLSSSGNHLEHKSSISIPTGSFVTLTATYDGSLTAAGLRLFLDGAELSYTTATNGVNLINALGDWTYGARYGFSNRGLNGYADFLEAFSRDLTPAEVADLVATPLTPISIFS